MARWTTEKHIYAAIRSAFSKGVNYERGLPIAKDWEEHIEFLTKSLIDTIAERYTPVDKQDELDKDDKDKRY